MFEPNKKLCFCDRCGHTWTTANTTPPKSCAKCKSKVWNQPRTYAGKYVPATMAKRFKPTGRAAAVSESCVCRKIENELQIAYEKFYEALDNNDAEGKATYSLQISELIGRRKEFTNEPFQLNLRNICK